MVQFRTNKKTGRRFPVGKGSKVQTIRFKKGNRFSSVDDVRKWLKNNQVRTVIKLTSEPNEYSARIIPPKKLEIVGSKPISKDVRLIIGTPK